MLKGKPNRVTQSTGHNKEKRPDERACFRVDIIEKVCLGHGSVVNTEMSPDFRKLEL